MPAASPTQAQLRLGPIGIVGEAQIAPFPDGTVHGRLGKGPAPPVDQPASRKFDRVSDRIDLAPIEPGEIAVHLHILGRGVASGELPIPVRRRDVLRRFGPEI